MRTSRSATSSEQTRKRLVVISGPSGVGKSAVADRLLKDARFGRAVTATTRAPRTGEKDGVDYVFLPMEEFRRRVESGWFLEHAQVYGRLYGTPKSNVDAVLATGRHCVLVIDVQGAETLRGAGLEKQGAVFVFLSAPNRDELERRLRARGLDAPESMARRLEEVARESEHASRFHHHLINHSVDETARTVASLVGVELV